MLHICGILVSKEEGICFIQNVFTENIFFVINMYYRQENTTNNTISSFQSKIVILCLINSFFSISKEVTAYINITCLNTL